MIEQLGWYNSSASVLQIDYAAWAAAERQYNEDQRFRNYIRGHYQLARMSQAWNLPDIDDVEDE